MLKRSYVYVRDEWSVDEGSWDHIENLFDVVRCFADRCALKSIAASFFELAEKFNRYNFSMMYGSTQSIKIQSEFILRIIHHPLVEVIA